MNSEWNWVEHAQDRSMGKTAGAGDQEVGGIGGVCPEYVEMLHILE